MLMFKSSIVVINEGKTKTVLSVARTFFAAIEEVIVFSHLQTEKYREIGRECRKEHAEASALQSRAGLSKTVAVGAKEKAEMHVTTLRRRNGLLFVKIGISILNLFAQASSFRAKPTSIKFHTTECISAAGSLEAGSRYQECRSGDFWPKWMRHARRSS